MNNSEAYGWRPSVEAVKDLQVGIGRQDYHVVWFDEDGFVMAHTDEERATIDLATCPLHLALVDSDEMDSIVPGIGYYVYFPKRNHFDRLADDLCRG